MSSKKKKSTAAAAAAADKKGASEQEAIDLLKKELEAEQKAKDTIEWSNMELERSVHAMEMSVLQLESGNHDADDSEIKQRYDNQRQLNVQLQEQKRWLEHELEQIKLKIQNDKLYPLPDPLAHDWENLSETELKRLVGQLEKTKSDLKSDLTEMQWRLDKEGKEFHHFNDFVQMYNAEIKNLNRILESLIRTGMVPTGFPVPAMVVSGADPKYGPLRKTGNIRTLPKIQPTTSGPHRGNTSPDRKIRLSPDRKGQSSPDRKPRRSPDRKARSSPDRKAIREPAAAHLNGQRSAKRPGDLGTVDEGRE